MYSKGFSSLIDSNESFIKIFKTTIDQTCKLKTTKTSKRNRMRNPWITSAIINSIAHRDRLHNKWKKTTNKMCLSGDPHLHEEYRKFRNNLSKRIRISKQ